MAELPSPHDLRAALERRALVSLALLVTILSLAGCVSSAGEAPRAALRAEAGGEAAPSAETDPPRVLIVTGDDVPAHDWRATTPVTRDILEEGADLEVFVSEDARILETSAIDDYDVLLLNYRNAPPRDPGENARRGLAEFVREGGGLVVVHFAVAAFSGWEEYGEIIGRVWVGRRSGKKISGHPPRGVFRAKVHAGHPATAGLEDFEADDELYSRLVGDGPIETLVSAPSEYSGREEPLAWTRSYGRGRVFVTVLGHDVRARESPAFRKLLVQGALWAAGAE